MNILCRILTAIVALQSSWSAAGDRWPTWRGPHHDGRVLDERPPLTWTAETVAWKTPIRGRGHSSPVIDRNRIFLTTADETQKSQSVLAFDLATGRPVWQRKVFDQGLDEKTHKRNSQATCTIACDGEKIFASFLNEHAVWIIALDYDGREHWRQNTGDYTSFWGYSASPTLYGETVIVAADHIDGGYVTALDRATGKKLWSTPRPKSHNYTSPVVHRTGDKDQLLLAGCDQFSAYDPATGRELWTSAVTTLECVGTAVVHDATAFASGGYPK